MNRRRYATLVFRFVPTALCLAAVFSPGLAQSQARATHGAAGGPGAGGAAAGVGGATAGGGGAAASASGQPTDEALVDPRVELLRGLVLGTLDASTEPQALFDVPLLDEGAVELERVRLRALLERLDAPPAASTSLAATSKARPRPGC